MEIYENSAPADPGFFEATSNDELLSKIEVNNVTVEYNDTYDFCIEFDDGRHIVHQIQMTELSRCSLQNQAAEDHQAIAGCECRLDQ